MTDEREGWVDNPLYPQTDSEPKRYTVSGKPVTCSHCDGDVFVAGRALLSSRGAALFGLEWTEGGVHTLTCTACSKVELFGREPDVR